MKQDQSAITFLFKTSKDDISTVKNLIQPHAIGAIQVLAPFQESENSEQADESKLDLAREIAEAIRPKGKQTMRKDALRAALFGYNSFINQGGESDDRMRVALSSLSKALRPFAPHHESPMDLVANRERQHFQEGTYKGTIYQCTPLGVLVRDELKKMDAI